MGIRTRDTIRVRMTRPPPAPVMDGFDVSSYRPGVTYIVDARVGDYLILAGYARAEPYPPSPTAQSWTEQAQRRAEDRIREELRDSRAKTIRAADLH
jgi:hypothetical protein